MRYNDKVKSLKCGQILPPSWWDGPDRLPMEVRCQHNKIYELFLSLWTVDSLISGQLLAKFLCDRWILSSSNTMRNPSLKTKSRQRISQYRISRHMLRKCLGSSERGVITLSLYGTHCWGHSPGLTNHNYVFKMTPVSEGWWDLGHRTWFGVCAYLQAGPDLQWGTDLNRGLALTC